jgi:hypothetical protein
MAINYDIYINRIDSARIKYEKLVDDNVDPYYQQKGFYKWERFDDKTIGTNYDMTVNAKYLKFYNDSLKVKTVDLLQQNSTLFQNLKKLSNLLKKLVPNPYTTLISCNCAKELVVKEVTSDLMDLAIPVKNLLPLPDTANNDDELQKYADGLRNIQTTGYEYPMKMDKILERIANLIRLKMSLTRISSFFNESSISSQYTELNRKEIYDLVFAANKSISETIEKLNSDVKLINDQLVKNGYLFGGLVGMGSASPISEDIKAASGHYIIPDIGIVNVGSIINNNFQYFLRPYFGVNVSLRAVNKNVPLNDPMNPSVWRRLSIVVGLTTFSITRQGTYDLFNNKSLFTGIGIRCSRAFRITPGILLYTADNPNPVLPVRYVVAPSLSLSLDLDVASWFSNSTGSVFKVN